ncbi:E3 ubiquitin-protein ligase arih1l-like [Artemia franciscana]|uniref:E3 ubiquitin-protein ligase arih1l-like n=1 Tax=Artemia franciscana TaxID=6661 RepID=UPI0032DAF27A
MKDCSYPDCGRTSNCVNSNDSQGFPQEELGVDFKDIQLLSDESDDGEDEPEEEDESEEDESEDQTDSYEILTPEQIVTYMTKVIRETNNFLQLPETTTRTILHSFKWNIETLLERYYYGNKDKIFQEAHVKSLVKKQPIQPVMNKLRKEDLQLEYCGICMNEQPSNKMGNAECGHRFCRNCLCEYLSLKIVDEGVSQMVECPIFKYGISFDGTTVLDLVKDSKVLLKYHQLITNSFVECNMFLRWCPGVGCNNGIRLDNFSSLTVQCNCGEIFCFKCGLLGGHSPISCSIYNQWIEKCNDEFETLNWIAVHTKRCPKCYVYIEKNGGCNQMVCKRVSCCHEFCWVCRKPWRNLASSNHMCEGDFYDKYIIQMQSLKLEASTLHSAIEEKMGIMMSFKMLGKTIEKALVELRQCRRVLMFAYVFCYYVKANNLKDMFQDNLDDLSNATECLSGYLERGFSGDDLNSVPAKVKDLMKYCYSRRKKLVEHVENGNSNRFWEYR